MNRSLLILLDHRVQVPPSFNFRKSFHQRASFKKAENLQSEDCERRLCDSWPNKASTPKLEKSFSIQSRMGSFWEGRRSAVMKMSLKRSRSNLSRERPVSRERSVSRERLCHVSALCHMRIQYHVRT